MLVLTLSDNNHTAWIGLIWFAIMDKVDSALAADLGVGLECVKGNLINFVFAALILGLTCTRTTSHHTSMRAVITSLLHEGASIVHPYR